MVGITGGIGTGKSTVGGMLRERGAIVLSADDAAREVLEPGAPAAMRVAKAFGQDYIGPDGRLDRVRLAERVFADPEARQRLEDITHPAILGLLRRRISSARRQAPRGGVVAVEVPLLYEAGMERWFDKIVVVAASEDIQIARLLERSGMTPEQARGRIAAQIPVAEKAARADYVVWNDRGREELEAGVQAIWRELIAPR